MIVGFEQDPHPNAPPGAGFFTADSGERAYAYDPQLAQSVSPPPPPQPELNDPSHDLMGVADEDQRLAINDYDPRAGAGGMGDAGGARQQAPAVASDVGGASSAAYGVPGPYLPPQRAAPPPQPAAAPPPEAAPAPAQGPAGPPAPPPPEVDPDEQARAQQQAYVNQKVYQAPVAGGLRPKSAEVISEGAEAPMAPEDWKELQDANEAIMQTQVAKAGVLRGQAEQQIMQARAQMPALQAQYEENKAQYDAARASAKQDLAKVQGMLQEVSQKKVDHGRFFARAGVFGQLAAGIAQALGASAAILSGTGRNMVADQINRMVDEDVAEQREEIENGRANANNALQILRDRYNFDIPQAESALKIAQLGVVNAQLKEYEGMKLSQDAQMGLESWMAENQKAQFLEARKLYTASMGKQTRKEALTYQQGSAGGYRDPTETERQKRLGTIKLAQETGTMAKPGEGEKIDPELVIYKSDGTPVAARSKEEARDVRKKAVIYKKIMPSLAAMEKTAGHLNTLSPDQRATFDLNWESAVSTLNASLGQGVMHDEDISRWRGYIGQGNFGAKRALAEMRALAQNSYDAEVDAQAGPQVKEDFSKGKPKATYAKKRATTPTVGRSATGTDATRDDLMNALKEYQ